MPKLFGVLFGSKQPHDYGTLWYQAEEKHADSRYAAAANLRPRASSENKSAAARESEGRHIAQRSPSPGSSYPCDHFINLLKTLPISFALFFGKRF
jgi:hypothetical protein